MTTHLRDLLLAAFLGAAAMYVAIFGWAWLGRDRPLEERDVYGVDFV